MRLFNIHVVILGFLLLPHAAAGTETSSIQGRIYFLNVGQGDMSFVSSPRHCLFFDAGGDKFQFNPPEMRLIQRECPSGKERILFISHYDKDHVLKTFSLVRFIGLQKAFLPYLQPKSALGQKILNALRQNGVDVRTLHTGQNLGFDGISLLVIAPVHGQPQRSENNNSLVLSLRLGSRTLLETGDAPVKSQLPAPSVEILKVAHHGSRHNNSLKLFERLKPLMCIVSSGVGNSYGHPHQETLDEMAQAHCAILRTDRLGSIEIEF